jgi:hypothetical protein
MKFNVYEAWQPEWKSAIERIDSKLADIFFLPEWYATWENYEHSVAKCIVAEEDDYLFVYPFLMRSIEEYDIATECFDIQSAYGYGGVITNNVSVPKPVIGKFNDKVTEWLTDNNVIAEFVREHPLLDHCRRDADYVLARKNIYIEASRNYRILELKNHQHVSKFRRDEKLKVVIDDRLEGMDEFVRLYHLNANRIGMSKYYFFSEEYFSLIKNLLKDHARLINIYYEDHLIHSLIYLFYGNKASLHLAGADHSLYKFNLSAVSFFESVLYSAELGLETVNIGGGLTADEQDGLYRFKKNFSNNIKDVYIGKKVINQLVYDSLVSQWKEKYPHLKDKYKRFFLKYRQVD